MKIRKLDDQADRHAEIRTQKRLRCRRHRKVRLVRRQFHDDGGGEQAETVEAKSRDADSSAECGRPGEMAVGDDGAGAVEADEGLDGRRARGAARWFVLAVAAPESGSASTRRWRSVQGGIYEDSAARRSVRRHSSVSRQSGCLGGR
ncbi:uncharacterized protein A4U43_C06F10860 [Asparagus officinalis]|uniref:Uncharacterized protein n=1 Tax=Asparagus officinalis TaxID=4686 RepID=A0A5P1ERN3_ASPOF|nr:uncharacterized protein A4U43_C06F10860 [Asparagus officinalis]